MKKIILALLLTVSANSEAGVIIAAADSNIGNQNNSVFFSNVFGDQNVIGFNSIVDSWSLDNWDTTATLSAASYSKSYTLSSASLVGADWLIASSGSSYTADNLQIISEFLSAGGNLWVGGEANMYSAYTPANQLLNHLNSSMYLNAVATNDNDTAYNTNLDTYTKSTTTFYGNYQSTIAGGVALYAHNGKAVVSIEQVTFAVPEPTSIGLFGLVLTGLAFSRKKKNH